MCLAIPGRIEQVFQVQGLSMGRVNFDGVVKEVCLACVPEAAVGSYVVVHAGFAISELQPAAATAAWESLRTAAATPLSPSTQQSTGRPRTVNGTATSAQQQQQQ